MSHKFTLDMRDENGDQVLEMRFVQMGDTHYSVSVGVQTDEGLRFIQVHIFGFSPEFNAAGIVNQALLGLPEEALYGPVRSSNLAGRLHRVVREVQARASGLRDNRPAIRGGQPVEDGGDSGG